MPEQLIRRFVTLTRTVNPNGTHTLDAIDQFGRAWWLIVGNPICSLEQHCWTEMLPLPGPREVSHE
jgi:hypothetical protein